MAFFKHAQFFKRNTDRLFDVLLRPGTETPHSSASDLMTARIVVNGFRIGYDDVYDECDDRPRLGRLH